MSFTGIQTQVDFYTQREAELTNKITDIMMSETMASKQTSQIASDSIDKRTVVANQYQGDTTNPGYVNAMAEIQDEYQLQLAKITSWESELEVQQNNLETELKATTAYKESFQSALKQNVQTSFKFGDGSSSGQ